MPRPISLLSSVVRGSKLEAVWRLMMESWTIKSLVPTLVRVPCTVRLPNTVTSLSLKVIAVLPVLDLIVLLLMRRLPTLASPVAAVIFATPTSSPLWTLKFLSATIHISSMAYTGMYSVNSFTVLPA